MLSTRDRLIEGAATLLDRGGPEAVTLREVGRLAGVSHNAPYKHFEDKAALLAAVAVRELRSLRRQLQEARDHAPDEVAGLTGAARAYVRWAMTHPVRFKLTFGSWDADDDELAEAASRAGAEFLGAFQLAARGGSLSTVPPGRAALLAWALVHGAVDLDLAGHLRKGGATAGPEVLAADLVALLTTGPGDLVCCRWGEGEAGAGRGR